MGKLHVRVDSTCALISRNVFTLVHTVLHKYSTYMIGYKVVEKSALPIAGSLAEVIVTNAFKR